MPAGAPVAIGTRGTVGSLVKKEIDYHNKFELRKQRNSSKRTQSQMMEMATSLKVHFKNGLSFLPITWSRKRRRRSTGGGCGGARPAMCSLVDVADGDNMNGIKGFNYTILKEEFDNLHV